MLDARSLEDTTARNEPLLPRSASFSGTRGLFDPLVRLSSLVTSLQHACEGDSRAVKSACVFAACASLTISLLGVLSPLAMLSPLHLLISLYLVPLCMVAVALELGDSLPALEPFRAWVRVWVAALTVLEGRGAMYVALGTLVAAQGDLLSLMVGLLDIAAGLACFATHCASKPELRGGDKGEERRSSERGYTACGVGGVPEECSSVPLLAFRRRVLYGMQTMGTVHPTCTHAHMHTCCTCCTYCTCTCTAHAQHIQRMPCSTCLHISQAIPCLDRADSAELVALSLELGLRLEPRARASALAQLDPEGSGTIDEEAFIVWWEQQSAEGKV